MEALIFHVDVNSAYLSWEAAYRLNFLNAKLDLRTIPSAVGGDVELRHGIILAKSIPAKKYGIKTGEAIWEAQKKYDKLYMVPPNYGLYETCSRAFLGILREYTPDVEQYSIDEAYMDMTGLQKLYGSPIDMAKHIKDRIREELGFTVNIGISSNKLLAKMASDFQKPDQVHTLFPEEIKDKMWPLPVSDLFFAGRAAARKLFHIGIRTIGELAAANPDIIKSHLKKHGEIIWSFANGIDFSPVLAVPPANKGYGNSTTIPFDVTDQDMAHHILLALAETVAMRIRKEHVKVEVVAVGIKYSNLSYVSHQHMLKNATDITNEIYLSACQLFGEIWNRQPVRHLGIHTGKVRNQDCLRQMNLFDDGMYEKWEDMDKAVDDIRNCYGNDCLKRAVFIASSIDHMSGGVSREKRSVDYEKIEIE